MRRVSIYHRKDGRWEGRIPKEVTSSGKRQYKAFFGKSKEDVEQKITQHQSQLPKMSVNVSFAQITDNWLASNECRIKQSTMANYRLKVMKHLIPAFGDNAICSISAEGIQNFISEKLQNQLSIRYVLDIMTILKSIFKYAVRCYQIQNPMDNVTMPRKQRTEIKVLSADEQIKLERYIAENHDLTTLGIALAKATGLRIGELCALQWKDIDLEKRILTVRKTIQRIQVKNGSRKTKLVITDPKSETSIRQIPIPEFMIPFLREFQGNAENYVLSGSEKPVEPRTMQYRFAKILKNVNLPSVHFHSLRHNFASNCVKLGFDIKALSEILGHSGVEITLNRYVHSSFEQKAAYMDRLKMAV